MRVTTRPSFATCLWDSATGRYPARPDADLVRWVGPVQPVRSVYVAGDEWRSYNVARDPVQIGGCVFWLDAATIPAQTDGTDLEDWPAVIGNSPTTPGNAPDYRTAAGIGENWPAVEFDDSNSEYMTVDDILNREGYEFTCVVAGKPTSNAEANWVSADTTGLNDDFLFGIHQNYNFGSSVSQTVGVTLHPAGGSVTSANDDGTVSTTVWNAWAARVSTQDDTLELWDFANDKTAATTSTAITNPSVRYNTTWQIGRNAAGNRYADIQMAECIIFDRYLTAIELESLALYLDDKYEGLGT